MKIPNYSFKLNIPNAVMIPTQTGFSALPNSGSGPELPLKTGRHLLDPAGLDCQDLGGQRAAQCPKHLLPRLVLPGVLQSLHSSKQWAMLSVTLRHGDTNHHVPSS